MCPNASDKVTNTKVNELDRPAAVEALLNPVPRALVTCIMIIFGINSLLVLVHSVARQQPQNEQVPRCRFGLDFFVLAATVAVPTRRASPHRNLHTGCLVPRLVLPF